MNRLEDVIQDNFEENETNLPSLINSTCLYIIDENRKVQYVKNINTFPEKYKIVGVCFMTSDHIYCFCIHRDFHGMGYGTDLLSFLLNYVKFMTLKVRKSNENAIKLYTKCGFIVVNEYEDFYNYTNKNENAFEMHFGNK
jgi:ribosomal protein S18 acetylase RimI-like enzyme